jgi:zinc transport system permease protein
MEIVLPFQWLSPNFMKNAFLAVVFASPIFGVLGTNVVSNRMSFFSDAIGHSALTGIALGMILGIRDATFSMILFSLFLGFLIVTVKIKGKSSADTIIGVFSSASTALGIVLLSSGGNFSKYQKYLVGDILSIQGEEIMQLIFCGFFLLSVWIFFYNKMILVSVNPSVAKSRGIKNFWIEQIFALSVALIVTVSIRWTGILVTNSMIVLPAASSKMISRNARQYNFFSAGISLAAGIAGLFASYHLDCAGGAAIVIADALAFLICLIFSLTKRKIK